MKKSEILLQLDHIQRLATALGKTESTHQTREVIVTETQSAFKADAIALYLLQPRGYYEMAAERGCTKEFREQWLRLYPENIPLIAQDKFTEPLFFGSASDFKREFPNSGDLVDSSKRKTIAYAPLLVNQRPIGLLGFSYNSTKKAHEKQFIMTLVNLCAQALERARLFELEKLATREAEAANRAKTGFLKRISHEIRTPINSIIGFADLLYESETLLPAQRNWAFRILRNAQHLNGLVGSVLAFSKIEADDSATRTYRLQGLNFLLVDDSVDNQVLVKHVLLAAGANVDTAENGMVGVEKALKSDYQVVIMDIQMPELDGNDAVSRLRSKGYKKPIVALTAEILSNQKQNSLQRGFDEYLPKPIDSDLLIKTLERLALRTPLPTLASINEPPFLI